MFMEKYVHGYSEVEAERLKDQANTLAELLHSGAPLPAGSRVLEAGCGVGAQTVILASNSPDAHFTSIDISRESAERAREKVLLGGLSNVSVEVADIFALPYNDESFDHVFVCFLLEHLQDPVKALLKLNRVLKTGGSITVIEGDHGSYYCHPRSKEADLAVQCLIEVQARKQGNSLIGRQLYPLLTAAGFNTATVSPRMVYVDSSRPDLVEGFTKKTFIAMIEGVKAEALALDLIDEETWNRGIAGLYRATLKDGTFCYTFFRATALK
jgi:ubiquinone/menaquinone biosynthesis C-methylase UbiE